MASQNDAHCTWVRTSVASGEQFMRLKTECDCGRPAVVVRKDQKICAVCCEIENRVYGNHVRAAKVSKIQIPKTNPDRLRRPNEVRMKDWREAEAKRRGVCPAAVAGDLARGKYPNLKIRRINQRVVFVQAAPA